MHSGQNSPRGLEVAHAFLNEATLYSEPEMDMKKQGVRLMTMHAAKGLEFETVFIPGCIESLLPGNERKNDRWPLEPAARRLFYVSLTRAKSAVHLLHARYGELYNYRFFESTPSRFLDEAKSAGHTTWFQRDKAFYREQNRRRRKQNRRWGSPTRGERASPNY